MYNIYIYIVYVYINLYKSVRFLVSKFAGGLREASGRHRGGPQGLEAGEERYVLDAIIGEATGSGFGLGTLKGAKSRGSVRIQ